jgi:tRNA (cytidine/uridine-2'-O-)-methyltransferase
MTDLLPSQFLTPVQPPLRIVLVEPDIPHNTGSIARTCAAVGAELHLIEPLGFQLTDKHMKRAGLDYWEHVTLIRHPSLDQFLEYTDHDRLFFFTTKGSRLLFDVSFSPGDYLVFGSETRGLPLHRLEPFSERFVTLPMLKGRVRSLNLAVSAGVGLYSALASIQRGL